MNSRVTLILGGARSGKSAWAEHLAARSGRPVVYVATATADDSEMAERIATHQANRPAAWHTVEAPHELGGAVRTHARPGDVVLVDCLTLWVSNAVLRQITKEPDVVTVPHEDWVAAEARVLAATGELLDSGLTAGVSLVLVSNEVGMGLVPPFPLGRRYRDILGRVNQAVARRADSVVLMIAGLPVDLRRLAAAELGVVTPGSKDPSPGDEPCDPLASP